MAALRCVCALLLVLVAAGQEDEGLQKTNVSEVVAAPEVPMTQVEPTASSPPVVTETPPPLPEPVWAVEHPVLQAKGVQESPGLGTPFVAGPDSVSVPVTGILGKECSTEDDCTFYINDAQCVNNKCICKTGLVKSTNTEEDKCIKVSSGLNGSCEEDVQCQVVLAGSECRENKCECASSYVEKGSFCWQKRELGGTCNITEQCEDVSFAFCIQGVCSCEDPLIPSPINKCLQPAGNVYLAPCVEDIQCSHSYGDESRCSASQCRCTNSYHYNGSKCIPDIKLGDACMSEKDCQVETKDIEGSRTCSDSVCTCASGFVELHGEDICSTKSSAEQVAVSVTWIMCIIIAKYYFPQ